MGLSACNKHGFYDYFLENMEALDLPAPRSLFATQATALAAINQLVNAVRLCGPAATLSEVAGATFFMEKPRFSSD
jgi:hypothetical protein